jgi:hypothetical protein
LYTGLSHLAFGIMCIVDGNRLKQQTDEAP